jgi:hypothetical protein
MLIYIISLTLQSAIDMTINNQCSDIKLISPVYFNKDTTYHIQFPQQVNSNSIMKANFITGMDENTFGGALLYRLQRSVDTSISTQILIIWKYRSYEPYSDVWLIEHESTLIWDEYKLRRLYNIYNSQYEVYTTTHQGEWLLDNNTELKTKCKTSYERDLKVDIIISKGEHLSHPIKPLWVDSNR